MRKEVKQYHVDLLTGVCLIVRKNVSAAAEAYAVRWKKLLLSLFCMRSSRFPQNLLRKHHRDVSCLPASETQHVACLLLRANLSLPGFVGQADIFCIEIHSVHLTHLACFSKV